MNRHCSLAALVLCITRVAGAQPALAPAEPVQEQPLPAVKPEQPTKPTPEDKPTVLAKYDNGTKLYTEDEKFELKIFFRNQMRFEATRPLEEGSQFLDRFIIPRSRLQVEGHIFGEDNRYKLELGMDEQGSFSFVKDMFMEKRLTDAPIWLRFGQWKRPFNRQEIVSDFSSTFNERSIENDLAGGGRDLGIALHDDYEKSPRGIEWVVGVFNNFNGGSDRPTQTTTCTQDAMLAITCATSRPTNVPVDFGPTLVVRVGWNTSSIKGYSESDLEGGPLRWAVAGSYKIDFANFAEGKQDSWADNLSQAAEIDTMIKSFGKAFTGGFVVMDIKTSGAQWGFYLQPSMFLTDKHLEIAGRFALTTATVVGSMPGTTVDRFLIEGRAALNYYWHGHQWKVASDGGFVKLTGSDPTTDQPDLQFRVMLQLQI